MSATRWAGGALILGGLLWIVFRPLVSMAWGRDILGLSYETYNRLMTLPLLCLLAGLLLLLAAEGRHLGWRSRAALVLACLGVGTAAAGVAVEFWVGGGIRYGDRALSTVGWMAFGIGYMAMSAALLILAATTWRTAWALHPYRRWLVATAGLHLIWPLATALGPLELLAIVLAGLGWVRLGYGLWSIRQSSIDTQA